LPAPPHSTPGAVPGTVANCRAFEFAPPAQSDCPVDFIADGFLDFFDSDDFVAAFEEEC
jgi:hypothetical protein